MDRYWDLRNAGKRPRSFWRLRRRTLREIFLAVYLSTWRVERAMNADNGGVTTRPPRFGAAIKGSNKVFIDSHAGEKGIGTQSTFA